jgi:hypothetical protein
MPRWFLCPIFNGSNIIYSITVIISINNNFSSVSVTRLQVLTELQDSLNLNTYVFMFLLFLEDKPRGALPLTKCHFSCSLLWLRRILEGMGGGGLKKKGGMLRGLRNHRDVNSPQGANPSNTAYYIIHHVAFFKLTKYHK